MKKVYDKTITRLAEMSRACYMHATEVADEKERELWFEQGREFSDMMDKAAQRKNEEGTNGTYSVINSYWDRHRSDYP